MAKPVPTISSHVLDTSRGLPAAGLTIEISRVAGDGREIQIGRPVTDADGRIADLLGRPLEQGVYRLRFLLGAHSALFVALAIDVAIDDVDRSYHLPLLLSPFGASTYLGS